MSEFSELAWDVINIKGAVDANDTIPAPTTPEVAIATFKEFILSRPDVGRIYLPLLVPVLNCRMLISLEVHPLCFLRQKPVFTILSAIPDIFK